jgi:hypothetical protein
VALADVADWAGINDGLNKILKWAVWRPLSPQNCAFANLFSSRLVRVLGGGFASRRSSGGTGMRSGGFHSIELAASSTVSRSRRFGGSALVMLMAAGLSLPARAAEGGYEPPFEQAFQTETVGTQDQGQVTFSWGGSWARSGEGYAAEHPASVEYGITDNLQVKFGLGPTMERVPESGGLATTSGDWVLGVKRGLPNVGVSGVHLAVGFDFAAPSDGNNPLSSGTRAYAPYLVVAKDLPGSSRVFTQVGFAFQQSVNQTEKPAAHVLNWSTGYYFPVGEFLLSTEFSLSTDRWNHAGQTREMHFTPGLFRRVSDRWWIGAGIPVGLGAGSTKLGVMVAAIYELNAFPVLH